MNTYISIRKVDLRDYDKITISCTLCRESNEVIYNATKYYRTDRKYYALRLNEHLTILCETCTEKLRKEVTTATFLE